MTAIKEAVYNTPAVALVNAACSTFQLYMTGVYEDEKCDPKNLDQSLLIVGYGVKDNKDVWICKNTWGTLTIMEQTAAVTAVLQLQLQW